MKEHPKKKENRKEHPKENFLSIVFEAEALGLSYKFQEGLLGMGYKFYGVESAAEGGGNSKARLSIYCLYKSARCDKYITDYLIKFDN
jgi:hypothetical protein